MSWFDLETRAGQTLRVKQFKLVPFAQSARITFPGGAAAVWSRPTAILAKSAEGVEVVLPIRDITRTVQIALFGLGILGSLLIWLVYKK